MMSHAKFKTGISANLLIFVLVLLSSLTFSQESVSIMVFVDRHALTLYIPAQEQVSLQNLAFSIQEQSQTYFLIDYTAFDVPLYPLLTPICFRLIENGETVPLPLECNPARTLTQQLSAANVFWFDQIGGNFRTVLLMQGENLLDFCVAGNNRCEMTYIPPMFTPVPEIPTATHTPTPRIPTATPTPVDPVAAALQAWANSPQTNDDWQPVERDFHGVAMVLVPPGSFVMGSTEADIDAAFEMCQQAADNGAECQRGWFEDEAQNGDNTQTFDEAFWIDKTEVTRAQYRTCVEAGVCEETPASDFSTDDNQPINRVTWFQAKTYCEWRDAELPTETQWEYAARGTDNLIFPWGNTYIAANVIGEDDPEYGDKMTAPVGSRLAGASWVSALDMSGNVWEWTNSLYQDYPYDEDDGREANTGDSTDVRRVLRGGSFVSSPNFLRAADRGRSFPDLVINVSFRCVSSPE